MACFLMLTVMSSGVAMAAYACPGDMDATTPAAMMPMENCAGLDAAKPALCATLPSDAQLALEHLAVQPALAPITVSSIAPVFQPQALSTAAHCEAAVVVQPGSGPPYLRTQRLRI